MTRRTRGELLTDLSAHGHRTRFSSAALEFVVGLNELKESHLRVDEASNSVASLHVDLYSADEEPNPLPWLPMELVIGFDDPGSGVPYVCVTSHTTLDPGYDPPPDVLVRFAEALLDERAKAVGDVSSVEVCFESDEVKLNFTLQRSEFAGLVTCAEICDAVIRFEKDLFRRAQALMRNAIPSVRERAKQAWT
jgi:hypothetical protein